MLQINNYFRIKMNLKLTVRKYYKSLNSINSIVWLISYYKQVKFYYSVKNNRLLIIIMFAIIIENAINLFA